MKFQWTFYVGVVGRWRFSLDVLGFLKGRRYDLEGPEDSKYGPVFVGGLL